MIPVTKPSLCSLEEFSKILELPWASGVLTHHGPLVQKFESELSNLTEVENVTSVVNGTIALQLALRSLPVKGEVIVPSFTWIATVSAIEYEGFEPIFCDIRSSDFNIDPSKVSGLITDKTVAIMPVHVFGQPCDILEIEKIAVEHGLEVIYDAAHAFGAKYQGRSALKSKFLSCVSFHATKILNCGEGGGIFTCSSDKVEKLERLRFFGHDENKNLIDEGTNAKMTEIHAALGLANVQHFSNVLLERKKINDYYRFLLMGNNFVRLQEIKPNETNYSYFPAVFPSEEKVNLVLHELQKSGILARRYFYPSLSTVKRFAEKANKTPISDDIAERIICLPCYSGLTELEQDRIVNIIKTVA